METRYSTLSLAEEETTQTRSRKTLYVVAGFAVVALAGLATFGVTGHRMGTTVDADVTPFNMNKGAPVNCESSTANFLQELPKYDPTYTPAAKRDAAFANACYYSFRCCTTVNGACGEGEDVDLYSKCSSCLESYPPRAVLKECRLYYEKKIALNSGGEVSCLNNGKIDVRIDTRCGEFLKGDPEYTKADLEAGKVPKILHSKVYEAKFAGIKTCWPQGGGDDISATRFKASFKDDCFELFSWCNQMCPRDDANSIEHKYCKNCFGSSTKAVKAQKQ